MFPYEPSPSPSPDTAPIELWEASPGVQGFLYGFFILGIALALLMWSMTRHLRKLRHLAEQEAAERQAASKAKRGKGTDSRQSSAEESGKGSVANTEEDPPKGAKPDAPQR